MKFIFILVRPQVAENIGASARALKTMGFDTLYLVQPCDYQRSAARWLAHGARDILDQATVFDSLAQAVTDMDLVIGTTAKRRTSKADLYSSRELSRLLERKKNSIATLALVFGTEERGLTNQELQHCDLLSRVPMAVAYPSLNLSQAVMIYAYVLAPLAKASEESPVLAKRIKYPALKRKVALVLKELGLRHRDLLSGRLMERLAALSDDDLQLVHALCNRFLRKFGIPFK